MFLPERQQPIHTLVQCDLVVIDCASQSHVSHVGKNVIIPIGITVGCFMWFQLFIV